MDSNSWAAAISAEMVAQQSRFFEESAAADRDFRNRRPKPDEPGDATPDEDPAEETPNGKRSN